MFSDDQPTWREPLTCEEVQQFLCGPVEDADENYSTQVEEHLMDCPKCSFNCEQVRSLLSLTDEGSARLTAAGMILASVHIDTCKGCSDIFAARAETYLPSIEVAVYNGLMPCTIIDPITGVKSSVN